MCACVHSLYIIRSSSSFLAFFLFLSMRLITMMNAMTATRQKERRNRLQLWNKMESTQNITYNDIRQHCIKDTASCVSYESTDLSFFQAYRRMQACQPGSRRWLLSHKCGHGALEACSSSPAPCSYILSLSKRLKENTCVH